MNTATLSAEVGSPIPTSFAVVEELYYIQNVGYVGNCLKWWAQGGHGYTCNLLKAWRVSKHEAESICQGRPDEDIPWPVSKAEALVQWHVVGGGE